MRAKWVQIKYGNSKRGPNSSRKFKNLLSASYSRTEATIPLGPQKGYKLRKKLI